ncbi:MAG TPA: hypothetical protein VHE54_14715 [Puia sp.]|nr:hypothetical protein [Puia sp.]
MSRQLIARAEVFIIVALACAPLFIHLPYRVNIFLSWEGAYRMSRGQLPFRDFGIPLGGMYWVIPAIFFRIFGPAMITLVKAQVFINIVSGLAFRSILRSLAVNPGIRLASVLLFCLSYSFFNFWPWYNHSVIVYELIGLAFLFRWLRDEHASDGGRYRIAWLAGAAFFIVCSFLTKQDGGGLAFALGCWILAVDGILRRSWKGLAAFIVSWVVLLMVIILPFLSHGFGYWFNHGQAPHSSRVSLFDILNELFGYSQWIKFYVFLIVLLAVVRWRSAAAFRSDKTVVLLVALTLGILGEAAVLQVTSYTPPDNNIFFHSFAFACVFTLLAPLLPVPAERRGMVVVLTAGIVLWWSGVWWNYTQRIVQRFLPARQVATVSPTGENVVNKDTYMINRDTTKDYPQDKWVECGLPVFRKIRMPEPTAEGIHRLMDMDLIRRHPADLRVLNMSELTPLAEAVPFQLEKNPRLPLWYHLGVGMFNRQADSFETRIRDHFYDLVLFEYIPGLNNFYPFRVRDSLRVHYNQVDSFPAPRRGTETAGVIEVFVRPAP